MKTALTALTRPRIGSGVSSCSSAPRITTLTVSKAPNAANAASDSQRTFDKANTSVPAPKPATAANMIAPTCRRRLRRESQTDITSAPIAGAALSRPRPQGPVCRMSRAKMGSKAVAPPSSTANRSREITPSTTGRARMNEMPANRVFSVAGSRLGGTWS